MFRCYTKISGSKIDCRTHVGSIDLLLIVKRRSSVYTPLGLAYIKVTVTSEVCCYLFKATSITCNMALVC